MTLYIRINHSDTLQCGLLTLYVQDLEGQTPLHLAVSDCVEISVKILLSAGADSGRLNHKLESAVHLAANLGFAGYSEFLYQQYYNRTGLKWTPVVTRTKIVFDTQGLVADQAPLLVLANCDGMRLKTKKLTKLIILIN